MATQPFQWTFTRRDLATLLAKLDASPNHPAARLQTLAA
jgi:hypothetical protein